MLIAALGLVLFVAADLWFFLVQHASRGGQFPPFHLLAALQRLARYAVAALFGGLPLYLHGPARLIVAAAVSVLALATVSLIVVRFCHAGLLAAALSVPCGLLLLGVVFNNTPIELRYLSFAVPFVALSLAGALATLPRRLRHGAIAMLLMVQAASLAGLMVRPETMQPARAAATAAAQFADGGIVLLPRGNDGVGIVGAFGIEAPPGLRLLVVGADETPSHILARIGDARRVVLALLAQDDASRASLPIMRAAVAGDEWRQVAVAGGVVAFDRFGATGGW